MPGGKGRGDVCGLRQVRGGFMRVDGGFIAKTISDIKHTQNTHTLI